MKFLDDQKTYLGNQLESEFRAERCFGILDAKIDEDALRSDVNSVYSKLQDMGVTKDDAKGLVSKLIEFVKGLFE